MGVVTGTKVWLCGKNVVYMMTINVRNTCQKIVLGNSDAEFRLGQETLQRHLSESNSKLVEHRAQSSVCEFMLAVWPSIAEGFPTVCSRDNLYNKCDKHIKSLGVKEGRKKLTILVFRP